MTFSPPPDVHEKTGPSMYDRVLSAARLASDADTMVGLKKNRMNLSVNWHIGKKGQCVVEVTELMDLACLGGDVPLLHADPFEKWTSMKEAWVGCGQTKFTTIWKRDMVNLEAGDGSDGPVPAQDLRLVKKAGGVPTMFGVAACTKENMEALANHPNLSTACDAFMAALRGGTDARNSGRDLPPELSGETGREVMRHLIGVGGPVLSCIQASFPQLKESRRATKRSSSTADVSGGPSVPKRTRTSAFLKAIGQTSSCAKIHNSVEEMGKRRAYAANKAVADQAMAIHSSGRNDMLLRVNSALKEAGIITAMDVMGGKSPTAAKLDDYVKRGGNERILAWRQYRNIHRLQGQNPKYHYLFDFVYGGAENHPAIVNHTPLPTVISDKSSVAKAPRNLTVGLAPQVSTVQYV